MILELTQRVEKLETVTKLQSMQESVKKNEVTNWVLGKFKPAETQLLEDLYKKIIAHKDKIFSLEIEKLQNLVN